MIAAVAKYLYVGRTSARTHLAYFGEVGARAIILGVILFIFLQLWRVTYGETGAQRLGGFTLAEMLWYLAMTEAITLSAPRVAPAVDEDVRTGAIAVHLLRPLSYPLYRLWTTLGERAVRFALNALVGGILALVMVGPIGVRPAGVAMFLLALPLAFVIDFLGYFVIGLGAFWLENTSGLTLIYSRLTMMLGGMMLPLSLFPASVQRVAEVLPFASVLYGPARTLVAPDARFFAGLLVRQAAAIAVFAAVVALVYRAALRRIESRGG
jgi:viologen exporter family transport system permease protein